MNDELKMMWKEGHNLIKVVPQHKKIMKNHSQDSHYPSGDSNQAPLEYKTTMKTNLVKDITYTIYLFKTS